MPKQFIVVVAVLLKMDGLDLPDSIKPTPAGILVEAETPDEALSRAQAWAKTNTEWEFGPGHLSVFESPNPADMEGAPAQLVKVNFADDGPRVVAAMDQQSAVMAATRRDQAALAHGMVSFEAIVAILEQNRQARSQTPMRRGLRWVKHTVMVVIGVALLGGAVESGKASSWVAGAIIFSIVLAIAYRPYGSPPRAKRFAESPAQRRHATQPHGAVDATGDGTRLATSLSSERVGMMSELLSGGVHLNTCEPLSGDWAARASAPSDHPRSLRH